MINCFVINGERINVTKNGSVSKHRDPARRIKGGEEKLEKEFSSQITTFNELKSKSSQYLSYVFGSINLKLQDLKALTKVFAQLLGTISPREVYRRKPTCYIWMDSHFDDILLSLRKNTVYALSSGIFIKLRGDFNPQPSNSFFCPQKYHSSKQKEYIQEVIKEKRKKETAEYVEVGVNNTNSSLSNSVPFDLNYYVPSEGQKISQTTQLFESTSNYGDEFVIDDIPSFTDFFDYF